MFAQLPQDVDEFKAWTWDQIQPYYDDLADRDLNHETLPGWLADWSFLSDLLAEAQAVLYIATAVDTQDAEAKQAYEAFLSDIMPSRQMAEQTLKEKLLDSGIEPEGYEIALRNLRAEADLYREENVTLLAEQEKLANEFQEIIGAQTTMWDGEEIPLQLLMPELQSPDRARREAAYRALYDRRLEDKEALDDLWGRMMDLRLQIAQNAGLSTFREYMWRSYKRFDYSPGDAETFHQAVADYVVPLVNRLDDKRRDQLGIDTLRPWDTGVDPHNRDPLKPYEDDAALDETMAHIFTQVDPQLGVYYRTMQDEGLLDLETRKGKGPGAFSYPLDLRRKPFIFQSATGMQQDVETLLHEAGHAFHVFESAHLLYHHQRGLESLAMEVAEVASMAMELLAAPYLKQSEGGFYTDEDYRRARAEHLEGALRTLITVTQLDALQHWVYTHHAEASDPERVGDWWEEVADKYQPRLDYTGLEDYKRARWQNVLHIYMVPFYMIEYGLAQLGAFQVWRNALTDQAEALSQYRAALALGGTVDVPTFYQTAGARFGFDGALMAELMALVEEKLEEFGAL